MMDWHDTQPAPGMLVEWKPDHSWRVVEEVDGERINLPSKCSYDGIDTDARSTTPLAPAPTPGGLWAALLTLRDSLGADKHGLDERERTILIFHSYGILTRASASGRCSFSITRASGFNTADDLALLDTALQHHRAVEAYCAQAGWQA